MTPLLPFLSSCLYGDASSYYIHLDEAERIALESEGQKKGMTAWFYRYLTNVLPDKKRLVFKKAYLMHKARALMFEHDLKHVCGFLHDNRVRFILIKGADLAHRLYPDSALRYYSDWDIWFYPDDCERALKTLNDNGWNSRAQYTDIDSAMKSLNHHFAPYERPGYKIEPHFTLPNFTGIDPHEIWNYTVEGQHRLSPELNLLMLTRHAAGESYFHANLPKLLTDAAVIMQQERVDFSKLHSMAEQWKLPYPGDLFAAFHLFFPKRILQQFNATPTESARFRLLFDKRESLGIPSKAAIALHRYKADGDLAGKLWIHLRACNATTIRVMFHLPKHGAWGKVIWAYICYFGSFIRDTLSTVFAHDLNLKDYIQLVESIEPKTKAAKV